MGKKRSAARHRGKLSAAIQAVGRAVIRGLKSTDRYLRTPQFQSLTRLICAIALLVCTSCPGVQKKNLVNRHDLAHCVQSLRVLKG